MTTLEVAPLILAGARSFLLFMLVPVGGDIISNSTRWLLALTMTIAAGFAVPISVEGFSWLALIRELAVGFILALPVLVYMQAASMLGELLDMGRGQVIANQYDPFAERPSVFSKLHSEYVWTLFVCTGGLLELVCQLWRSYELLPPGVALSLTSLGGLALSAIPRILLAALAPLCWLLVLLWIVESCMGLIGKFVPGLRVQLEGYSIRTIVCALWYLGSLSLGFWSEQVRIASPSNLISELTHVRK